jgi:hypothetical protein
LGLQPCFRQFPGQIYAGHSRHNYVANNHIHRIFFDKLKHAPGSRELARYGKPQIFPREKLGEPIAYLFFVIYDDQPV